MDYTKLLQKTILLSFLLFFGLIKSFAQNAGTDQTVCSSTANLSAIPGSGVWSTTGGATILNPSSQTTQVDGLDLGVNTFTWTVAGLGSDEVLITNNQVAVNAGVDVLFDCSTTNTLSGNAPTATGSGVWTMKYSGTGAIIDNSISNISTVSNLQIGDNVLVWTIIDKGCSASDEVIINNSLPLNEAGNDQTACSANFVLNAQIPTATGVGTWNLTGTGSGSFGDIHSAGSTVQVAPGVNVFRWDIDDNGCRASKMFTVTNNQVLPNAGADQDICNASTNLQAQNLLAGENGLWTVISPQGETFDNPSITNPLVDNIKQGVTTFVWMVSNGKCSDTDEVQITNNTPTIDAGPDVVICENHFQLAANITETGSTGIWTNTNSAIVATPSKYNSQVTNLQNGINLFTWTIDNGNCTVQDNVSVRSNFIDVVAGNPHTGDCSDTFVLNATDPLTVGSGMGTGFWKVTEGLGISFDDSNSNTTTARNLTGFNRLKWTIIDNSCTFSDEIEYVNNLPTQASTAADMIVCSSNSMLSAVAPAIGETGQWTIETGTGNATIETPSNFQTAVGQLDQGTNAFRWTISNGNCSTYDIITITNDEVTATAGADEEICSSSYTLNATISVGNGYWTTTSTTAKFENSTSPTSNVTNLSPGSNVFTWTAVENSCSATDDVIIVDNTPQNITAGADQIVCQDLAVLNGSNPGSGTGLWEVGGIGNGTFVNSSFYKTNVSNLMQGANVFKWTVTWKGCSASATTQVDRNSIDVSAGKDSTICNLQTFGLDGTVPGTGITGVWTLNGGNGTFSNASLYNSDVSQMANGINTYVWTLTDGYCTNFAQVVITSNTPDTAIVGADQIICSNQTTVTAVEVFNGTGSWSVQSGGGLIANSLLNNALVSNISNGLNTFRWTVTKNGCSLFADQLITNNTVDASISESQIVICSPSHSTTLTGSEPIGSGTSGLWTKTSVGAGVIESPSNYITVVSGLDNGLVNFKWTVSNSTCSGFDQVDVINNYYTASAAPVGSDVICIDNTAVLGSAIPQDGTGLWTASSAGTYFDNSQSQTTAVRGLPVGTSSLTWTVTKDACDASYSFDITNNFIATNAGGDIVTCESTASLSAQALEANETGLWTANNVAVSFANPSMANTGISNIPQGASLLTWTINALGCTASDDLNLTNNSFQVTAGNDATICGTTQSLYGSDPLALGTGRWAVEEGNGVVANISTYSTIASNLSNGANSFSWTVSRYGCTASDTVTIVNDLYVAEASGPAAVCVDEATLNATALPTNSGAVGVWTTLNGGGVCQTPDQAETLVLGLAPGNNTFRWTVTKGACVDYDNVVVVNNEISVYAGPNQATCENVAYLFATPLSATGIGEWTSDQPTVIIADHASSSTEVSELVRGLNNFTWIVTDKGCTGNSAVSVTNNNFDAYAGEDQMVTVSSTNMEAVLPDDAATGSWSIFTGNASFADATDPSTAVMNLTPGTNQYRWTISWNNCSAFDEVVVIYNLAASDAGIDQQLCTDNTVLSANNPSVGAGVWSVVNGSGTFQDAAKYNTAVSNVMRGNNTYRWTVTAYGIDVYDDVVITNNSFDISAGTDMETCDWVTTLNAESPGANGSGQWNVYRGGGYFADSQSESTTVDSYQDGINQYVWSVQRGDCSAKDTVQLTFTTPPTTADAGSDIDLCESSATVLAGNQLTVGTGLWTTSDNTVNISGANLPDATVTNLPSGATVLNWTTTNGNCVSFDEVIVRNNTSVSFVVQPESQQLNQGGSVFFTLGTTGDVTAYQWQRNGSDLADGVRITGTANDTLAISSLIPDDAGQYRCLLSNFCADVESDIATLSIVSGIEDLEANGIRLYPNPSNGLFNIEFEESNLPDELIITALNGQRVFYKSNLTRKERIDISKSGSGVYIINIRKGEELIVAKIVVNR